MLLSESEKEVDPVQHDPREISKMMLTNFHLLLKAQIEIGRETNIKKINEILSKYGIDELEND